MSNGLWGGNENVQTKWGDESIQGTRITKWEPALIGHTHRIRFLSPPVKKLIHYQDGVGYIECFHGVCCDRCEKAAEHRVGVVIFAYDCDRDGQLPVDENNVPILRGKVMPMILSENLFVRLSSLDRSTRLETEGRKSLETVDVLISVPNDHAKKFKKWEIQLAESSFFHRWAATAKTEKNPEGSEEVRAELIKHREEMKRLWNRLPNELGRKITEQDFLAKMKGEGNNASGAPGNADSLPDVGDPTAALADL